MNIMGQDFEFRDDPWRTEATSGCPVMLCPVKWEAANAAIDYVRRQAKRGTEGAPRIAALLDHVGITPEFEPSPANPAVQSIKPELARSSILA
jgi:hypothetical protein